MKGKGTRGNSGLPHFDSGKISFLAIVHDATLYIVVHTIYPLYKIWSETEVVENFLDKRPFNSGNYFFEIKVFQLSFFSLTKRITLPIIKLFLLGTYFS